MALAFSQKIDTEITAIVARYPEAGAAVIPVLTLAAREFGSLTDEVIALVSARLKVPVPQVLATATFYTMLPKKPVGKFHVQVCTNVSCSLLGADHLMTVLEGKLGISRGETTKDGRITLSEVECLGSCGSAPVMLVNETFHENLDEQELDRILAELTRG